MRRSDFVIAGIGLLILLIGVLLAWMIDLGRDDRRFTGELTMLMFAGVAATLLWTGGKIVLAAAAPLATSPTLNFIAGTLSKHALEMGGSRRYYVSIERRLFDVSYDEYAHVLAGLEYRAYFFPVRNQLAALEPIERDEPEPKDMTAYRD